MRKVSMSNTKIKQRYLQTTRGLFKFLVLLPIAGLSMGNQSCQKQPETSGRSLKKIIELGRLKAQPIVLPNGGVFDFQFVANQQIYGVISQSEGFAIRDAKPLRDDGSSGLDAMNLSQKDRASLKMWAQQKGIPDARFIYSKDASCMVNLPQFKIEGSINSFEMLGGGGLQLGYGQSGSINSGFNGASVGFEVQQAQLDMSMRAKSPLNQREIKSVNVTKRQTNQKVNFSLSFGMFNIGPSFYYTTPLASVTKGALTKAIDSLKEGLKDQEWYTRVFTPNENEIWIIGGDDVGLKVHDQLAIYNEEYFWNGEPCAPNSTYLGGGAEDNAPAKIVEVVIAGDFISKVRPVQGKDLDDVVVGAKVKLYKFAEDVAPKKPQPNAPSNPSQPGIAASH